MPKLPHQRERLCEDNCGPKEAGAEGTSGGTGVKAPGSGGARGGESTRTRADLLAGFEEALEGPRAGYMHVAAHHLVRVGHGGRHHLGKCADAHLCPTATPRYALGLSSYAQIAIALRQGSASGILGLLSGCCYAS